MADSDTIIEKPPEANATDSVEQDGDDPFVEQGLTSEDIDQKIETIAVTTQSLTSTVKARAYRSSSQAITTATTTKVQLDTETYDVGENFDNATNYRFVAPVDGYYFVSGLVTLGSLKDGGTLTVTIQKNGTIHANFTNTMGVAGTAAGTVPDIIQLDKDDYVELFVRHDHGSNRNVTGTTSQTFLVVHLLSNTNT